MNERILELIQQATRIVDDGPDLFSMPREIFNKELFAELIVRECISEVEEMKRSGVPIPIQGGLNLGVVALKLHFGVEE